MVTILPKDKLPIPQSSGDCVVSKGQKDGYSIDYWACRYQSWDYTGEQTQR
jgi:hypothetical protein